MSIPAERGHRVVVEWFHDVADVYWRHYRRVRHSITTAEAWRARRNYLKAVFLDAIGGLPEPAPLQPRELGRLQFDGYHIERVAFESTPGLVVTANVYVPDGLEEPAPAILVPCGHAEVGKAYEYYTRLCHGFVSKGYVVLIYDPIGQGERRMYRDDGGSVVGGCTAQHTHLAAQLAAAGLSLARYMIFDSIRCIDYLVSRPEVDAARIGCTGSSGGGTNTAYVSALDERIAAAMPVCYITSLEARQRSEKIADWEQNLYGQIERGLDHHDYVAMVAPRAVCIGAARGDFFPVEGARETFAAARDIFELLGVPDRCALVEVDGEHGYLPELRAAAYRWFNRWFGVDADDEEPDVDLPDEEDLRCFADGVPAEATHRVLLAQARDIADSLIPQQAAGDELREELAALIVHIPEDCQVGTWAQSRHGWQAARVNPSSAPPLLVARRGSDRPSRIAVCWRVEELGALPREVDGAIILFPAVEPELGARADNCDRPRPWIHSDEAFLAFYAQLLGTNWVYLQAARVLAGLHAFGGKVAVEATGTACMPALYAAALDERVETLRLTRPLWSYASVLDTDIHVLGPPEMPFGVLASHDLPAVMALLAPRRLAVQGPLGADGRPLAVHELPGLEELRASYAEAGAEDKLVIRP